MNTAGILKKYLEFTENSIQLLIILSSILFFITILLLYFSIFISIFPIIESFILLIYQFDTLDLQKFVKHLATLIEFALFDIVLFMLANGIYVYIFKPLVVNESEEEFSLQEMFVDFVSNLSRPFLMVLASIIVVSVFEVIIDLYIVISHEEFFIEKDLTFFYFKILFIFSVLLAIITINILIQIEKSICHKDEN